MATFSENYSQIYDENQKFEVLAIRKIKKVENGFLYLTTYAWYDGVTLEEQKPVEMWATLLESDGCEGLVKRVLVAFSDHGMDLRDLSLSKEYVLPISDYEKELTKHVTSLTKRAIESCRARKQVLHGVSGVEPESVEHEIEALETRLKKLELMMHKEETPEEVRKLAEVFYGEAPGN